MPNRAAHGGKNTCEAAILWPRVAGRLIDRHLDEFRIHWSKIIVRLLCCLSGLALDFYPAVIRCTQQRR